MKDCQPERHHICQILIMSVTLIVLAIPEGLPLAVLLAPTFMTKQMTYEKLLVRILGSCKTIVNMSVICTDKMGTLTQNVMSVVAGAVGIHSKFVQQLGDNQARTNAGEEVAEDSPQPVGSRKHLDNFSIDQIWIPSCHLSSTSCSMPPSLSTLQPSLMLILKQVKLSSSGARRRPCCSNLRKS